MNNNVLYLECGSGISGDMTVGALIDLGADPEYLKKEIAKLPIDNYEITVGRTKKCGIDSCAFRVEVQEEHQHHRTFGDIRKMIRESDLKEAVKDTAEKIFYVLAKAEAKVHGTTVEKVHFHEVGAVDSIVDIVGAAICIDELGITDVALGSMAEGSGTVMCQHGEMPVPVPAVAQLAAEHGLLLKRMKVEGEMITPTGAAIAAALRTRELTDEEFVVRKIGIGAGTKDFPHANILRAMLIEINRQPEDIWVLETNVDDCSGEQLGFLQDKLLKSGVRDVLFRTVYMKKNRPGYQIQVICDAGLIEQVEDQIFCETTSIGIRRYQVNRTVLERRMEKVPTPWGEAAVKVCGYGGKTLCYPEYESIRQLADESKESYRKVYQTIKECAESEL